MKNKRQHIVPRCYLSAWVDPVTPPGQHAALWKFSKDGSGQHRRSPEKTFIESDRYTIRLPNGDRDLIVEQHLDKIENAFSGVLRRLHRHEKLGVTDLAKIAAFTAAMLGRTRPRADNWRQAWTDIRRHVAAFEGDGRSPSKASGSGPPDGSLPPNAVHISTAEIDGMLTNIHPEYLSNTIEIAAPILFRMDLSIFSTDDPLGFITSDNPCIMHNPTAYRYHPIARSPGLRQKDVQVLLPLSPRLLIAYTHKRTFPLITPLPVQMVNNLNRLMVWNADKEIISWRGELKDEWFDTSFELPADAWKESDRDGRIERPERFDPSEIEVLAMPELLDDSEL